MKLVIYPNYLPNIIFFSILSNYQEVIWYIHGKYQKQTYRNRTKIYGPNGVLDLIVPIIKPQNDFKKDFSIITCNQENWKKKHWNSIENSYSSSPFFEYYKDELYTFFFEKKDILIDFNLNLIRLMLEWLNIKLNFNKSLKEIKQKEFEKNLILCKKNIHLNFPKYTQVFNYKNGFIENLNILDLIFNLGPESSSYLKNLPTSSLKI
ncbi:MAG: WbqC family protein [Flavobacteriaceae bacterium]|nr:WbqC family protein [Flavobacteriaceae bacterium]